MASLNNGESNKLFLLYKISKVRRFRSFAKSIHHHLGNKSNVFELVYVYTKTVINANLVLRSKYFLLFDAISMIIPINCINSKKQINELENTALVKIIQTSEYMAVLYRNKHTS